ncbi:MAG TPA: protein kinase [Vicinamibacterales bacterium]|nr:protein kinase [Vicinamibacterales bacterium]
MADAAAPRELTAGDEIGRYRIVRPLGRGGMGVVYVARDERLDREVAIKMIAGLVDDVARARFWREARSAASVNHPNICQVFEVDESTAGIYLAMELLEGEPLDRRLTRGALPSREALPVALAVLSALDALHARGFVHRDVKPSNIFITHHGPKLLDFGLARPAIEVMPNDGSTPVTQAGVIVGTPQYMAPEQVTGASVDGRTDLYSVGAVLFQMLAGRPPFTGTSGDVLFAALKENPPALQGPPEVVAIDRVIRRAMRKEPLERYSNASDMSADLSAISPSGSHAGSATPVRALTRIVVPPLRMARTDPDIEFLSFGLAEAMSGSLAMFGNVVVRAPAVAAKWSEDPTDLRKLAVQADVDLVISSSLRRAGPQLRVTTQVIDPSSGTVVGAATVNGMMDDIFALEDALTVAATGLLSSHVTMGTPRPSLALKRDVPANPRAFELYLRGLEESRALIGTARARELFEAAVDADPSFAPAWAALGRAYRVWGKYFEDREASNALAEAAFAKALSLSPDLPLAHRYLTHLESESGRAADAIARLLRHAATNRHDAQLFAGLVHACRYAGLFDASVAAHDEATRLDPNVLTGVEYSLAHLALSSREATERVARASTSADADFVLAAIGDERVARQAINELNMKNVPPAFQRSVDAVIASFTKPREEATLFIEQAMAAHTDPEALFLFGAMMVRIGNSERGLDVAARAVRAGYTPALTLAHNRSFEAVREHPLFVVMLEEAQRAVRAAQKVFENAGGPEMLGMPAATRLSN